VEKALVWQDRSVAWSGGEVFDLFVDYGPYMT
jgi:hypothetical protein